MKAPTKRGVVIRSGKRFYCNEACGTINNSIPQWVPPVPAVLAVPPQPVQLHK